MALNNTAIAYAEWSPESTGLNAYSGQIMLGSLVRHRLEDFRRGDEAVNAGSDALFGSTSVQAPVTLVAGGTDIEIKIMSAGEIVNDYTVNGKECSGSKSFHAFVSPIATCSAKYGRNFSGFRAVAVKDTGTKWKPMLYMNANGRWIDMSELKNIGTDSVSNPDECRKLLVQKICQE
jgi:hypothetical protein